MEPINCAGARGLVKQRCIHMTMSTEEARYVLYFAAETGHCIALNRAIVIWCTCLIRHPD